MKKNMKEEDVLELDEFSLPSEMTEPEVNANTMILFGKHKCGKTTAVSSLPNCLIIDTEQGSKKVKALVKQVPEDRGPVGKMRWLEKIADRLIEEGKPYDYVVLDTLTEVNEWAEWSGTYRYMNSTQGKAFNREKDEFGKPIKGGAFLDPSDDSYESVHSLPEGYGYRWSREDVMRIFNKFQNVARKCVIFICHVEDKFLAVRDTTEVVVPKQLALTGKLRDVLPRKVDAIGYVYNDKGEIKVNFVGTDDKIGGSRAKHLMGYNNSLEWSKIFIDEKN